MLDRIRDSLTYANVMSTVAVFAVLAGGSAYAASKIGAGDIRKNAVRSKHIKNKQVKAADLADRSVTRAKLAAGSVDGGKIVDGSLSAADLAGGSVTTSQLADGAVTAGKVNYDSVGLVKTRRIVVNPAPNTTDAPELLEVGDIMLTASCLENGGDAHTASVTVSGPGGVMSGVSGGDWSGPASVAANNLPSSAGTAVGLPSLATTHKLIALTVATPTTTLQVDLFVAVNLFGDDCVFAVSGTRL